MKKFDIFRRVNDELFESRCQETKAKKSVAVKVLSRNHDWKTYIPLVDEV